MLHQDQPSEGIVETGAPRQAGGAARGTVPLSLAASWMQLLAHASGTEMQAASQGVVHIGILLGTQAVPLLMPETSPRQHHMEMH